MAVYNCKVTGIGELIIKKETKLKLFSFMAFSGKTVPQVRLLHGYTDRHTSSKQGDARDGEQVSGRKEMLDC